MVHLGCGKSTWVKEHGLENYTLSADTLRLLVESPIIVPDKSHRVISQKNDGYVWQLLFELLERRMQRGEFIIVDATHSRRSDFSRYNNLCSKYRYRKYYVSFADVPLSVCKERNKTREDYRRVPDEAIEKIYSRLETQDKTSGWVEADKNNIWETVGTRLYDLDKYNHIHIFGDIHGCKEPLAEYFERNPYNENDFYIFTGDYIDRGIQNKETLELLIGLSEKKNTLFLEGNHEHWFWYYANDEMEEVKSKEFIQHTLPQIIDMDKAKLREFYRKLGQMAYFNYDGKKYFVSHGGISYMPEELQLIATEQLIHGVGTYNDNIDEIWSNNEKEVIQVHGHRNTFEIENTDTSYNLENRVEFGGNLRVLRLEHGKEPELIKIKNDVYKEEAEPEEENTEVIEEKETVDNMEMLTRLKNSKDIRECQLGNNISSFNFTRNAFYDKKWNALTTTARGLFVNTLTGDIVARGYEKFFNINEVKETNLEHLLIKFKDKHITMYKKENGYLGILSVLDGEFFFASKSTNKGEFAEKFKEIFENSDIDKEKLKKTLQELNATALFEVIDPEFDPHIIKYDKPQVVLLDIVMNSYQFERMPYDKLVCLAEEINAQVKKIYKEFDDVRAFHQWYIENTDENDMSKTDIEGVVIECDGFMTKLKFPFYNFWKFMRSLKEKVKANHKIDYARLFNATSNYFYKWLRDVKETDEELLNHDIIYLREVFTEQVLDKRG